MKFDIKALEGEMIRAIISPFDADKAQDFKLHAVETYGIWVESQTYTESLLVSAGRTVAPRSLVVFVPWSAVSAVFYWSKAAETRVGPQPSSSRD